MDDELTIAVIIPTLNSAATIESCLDSIRNLNYAEDKIHVIVVDHGSSDETKDIVLSRGIEFHSKPEAVSIAELRNIGAEMSKSELLAFLDSDCIPHPDWLNNAIRIMKNYNVNVTGSDHLIADEPSWFELLWFNLRKHQGTLENIFIPSGNLIINRNTFLEVGGFDVDFISGEDADICYRLIKKGYRIVSSDSIKVVHLNEPKTLGQFFRREIWHGKGMFRILSRHMGMQIMKIPAISMTYLIALLVSLVLLILGSYFESAIIAIILLVILPFLLSFIKLVQGRHRNLLGGTIIYSSYFIARMFSIVRYNQFADLFKGISAVFKWRRG